MTYNPPPYGYGPPPPGAPSPFVTPTANANKTPWLLLVVAFVVGAVVAGLIVYFVAPGSDDGPTTSSESITLPDKIGSLQRLDKFDFSDDADGRQARNAAAQQKDADANADRISKLHGGAGAAIATYASSDLERLAAVTAIRTELDAPYVYTANPAREGLAVPMEETKTFGDVTCVVHNPTTQTGGTVDTSQVFAEFCQRRSSGFTIQVRGLYMDPPSQTAKLTDKIFDALS